MWTEEKIEKLRQMWEQGKTSNEIAKKLGVTKNSIVGKVHRLCLKARPSPIKNKDEKAEVVAETLELSVENEEDLSVSEETAGLDTAKEQKEKKSKKPAHCLKLVELDSHTCRWPIGDPRDDDFCFCGRKVRVGQTYCDEHSMIAYVKALHK